MGVSKLSEKVFLKVNYSFKSSFRGLLTKMDYLHQSLYHFQLILEDKKHRIK